MQREALYTEFQEHLVISRLVSKSHTCITCGPKRLVTVKTAELFVAALQTATLAPAARASAIRRATPSRGSIAPLPVVNAGRVHIIPTGVHLSGAISTIVHM